MSLGDQRLGAHDLRVPVTLERPLRADGARNRATLLQKANVLLTADPYASPEAIAAAAGVHRGTLYRHFPRGIRQILEELGLRLIVVPADQEEPRA